MCVCLLFVNVCVNADLLLQIYISARICVRCMDVCVFVHVNCVRGLMIIGSVCEFAIKVFFFMCVCVFLWVCGCV